MTDRKQQDLEELTDSDQLDSGLLGIRLKEAREYLGLSQEFVAEKLSIPRASVSAIETGKRKVSVLELRAFARLYKKPISFFIGQEQSVDETSESETVQALFRATKRLSEEDRQQVLRFAQFLRAAGRAPTGSSGT